MLAYAPERQPLEEPSRWAEPPLAQPAAGPHEPTGIAAGHAPDDAARVFGHYADAPSDTMPCALPHIGPKPTADFKTPSQGVEPADPAGDLLRGLAQEGPAGLLDVEGMLDRQRAQRDLASRFQVVPDDWKGKGHNQVTRQEFEALCKTYSDIRLGRGDLTIDTGDIADKAQAQRYRDAAMMNLADMMMTTSGRKQVMTLSDNVYHDDAGGSPLGADGRPIHHHTTIRPEFKAKAKDHGESSYETDHDQTNVTNPADLDKRYRKLDGSRGEGADATIYFSPVASAYHTPTDVALAHEMQHAFHTTQGVMARGEWHGYGRDATPLPFGRGPVENAERQATGLDYFGRNVHDPAGCSENQYRMERNQLGIGAPTYLKHYYYPPGLFDDRDDV